MAPPNPAITIYCAIMLPDAIFQLTAEEAAEWGIFPKMSLLRLYDEGGGSRWAARQDFSNGQHFDLLHPAAFEHMIVQMVLDEPENMPATGSKKLLGSQPQLSRQAQALAMEGVDDNSLFHDGRARINGSQDETSFGFGDFSNSGFCDAANEAVGDPQRTFARRDGIHGPGQVTQRQHVKDDEDKALGELMTADLARTALKATPQPRAIASPPAMIPHQAFAPLPASIEGPIMMPATTHQTPSNQAAPFARPTPSHQATQLPHQLVRPVNPLPRDTWDTPVHMAMLELKRSDGDFQLRRRNCNILTARVLKALWPAKFKSVPEARLAGLAGGQWNERNQANKPSWVRVMSMDPADDQLRRQLRQAIRAAGVLP